jgi:putative ATP-dependent endonuclease of OLD family
MWRGYRLSLGGYMARIRKIEIENFRGIKALDWKPSEGINCLIGPGDSGKSSVLDAIDLCLGARRNLSFTDADFHKLDVSKPIKVKVTVGELDDALKNIDTYGLYVRSFDAGTGEVEDEPDKDGETVLTIQLAVESDLEPNWTLMSARAAAQGLSRNLSWGDRIRLAPTRIGNMADFHLGWRKGSVLNKLTDEEADASAALVKAARDARVTFGDEAQEKLGDTLAIVAATAKELGIPIGDDIKAMLDAHSVSFSGGTISLHDADGIPLKGLGIGSTRLLIAGLQKKAAKEATMILIDELEHGLEPHRIIRLIGSLGAKENPAPLQVFMTTHSPVALRELSGKQLYVTRRQPAQLDVIEVGDQNGVQGTIRTFPEAFLAPSVVICEGASEVGLIRGLDQFRVSQELLSISAEGTALVDGGGATRIFDRNDAFVALGYRTAILRDDDLQPDPPKETAFICAGGKVVTWGSGRALEDELFASLSEDGVMKLLTRAIELHGEDLVDAHIKSATDGAKALTDIQIELQLESLSIETRAILGKAARTKRAGWFKTGTWMEDVARNIVGPDLEAATPDFQARIADIFDWAGNAGE